MILRASLLRQARLPPPLLRRTLATAVSTTPTSTSLEPPLDSPTHPVALAHAYKSHIRSTTAHLGSTLTPHYKPHELWAYPPSPSEITLELLLASQSHIGHAIPLWNPANARYIFGIRSTGGTTPHNDPKSDPIHIISLDATAAHLRRACKVVSGVAERGGLILFVGTRDGQARAVVKAAKMAGGCHLFGKWIPGSITNGQQILGRCAKKVVNEHDEEVPGFSDQLFASAALKPDLVVCLNPVENYVLLHECGLNHIPTIGVIDTDANPTWVTYPIPANDDSVRCIQLIAGVLGRAGEEGQLIRKTKAQRGVVEYQQDHGLLPPTEEDEESVKVREKEQGLLAGAMVFDHAAQLEELEEMEETGVDPSLLGEETTKGVTEEVKAEEAVPYERDATPVEWRGV